MKDYVYVRFTNLKFDFDVCFLFFRMLYLVWAYIMYSWRKWVANTFYFVN